MAETADGQDTNWSYITGRKGLNRIRVYRRYPGGPIQVEWYDQKGRHRQTLKKLAGSPIHDTALAREIADHMAEEQRKKREQATAHGLFGRPNPKTLKQLFTELHVARTREWTSKTYRQQQESIRDWWLSVLGGDTALQDVTANAAEAAVARLARARKWTAPRTRQKYLRYLRDAYIFAQKKLKWIGESENLSELDIPKARGRGKAYTDAEVRAILFKAPEVDLRSWGVGEVAYATGRRLSAIRTLPETAYRLEQVDGVPVPVIAFPGETDKSRQEGLAVLTEGAVRAIEALRRTAAVQATGLLFPAGDLASTDPSRNPATEKDLIEWWHTAEVKAEVEYVKGRAYHGIKRRFATTAPRLLGELGAAAKQSGTTRETLARIYDQDDIEAKVKLARLLDEHRKESAGRAQPAQFGAHFAEPSL